MKLRYEEPRSNAAIAYSELAGNGHCCGRSSSRLSPGQSPGSASRSTARLGRRDVDHDQMRPSFWLAMKAWRSAWNVRSCRARRFPDLAKLRWRSFRSSAPRPTRCPGGSLVDLVEPGFDPLDEFGVDRPAFGVHPAGFVVQPHVADFVAADDKVLPVGQIAAGKLRQVADQADRRQRSFFRADRPTRAVEATPPRAPMSQRPIRERAMGVTCKRNRSSKETNDRGSQPRAGAPHRARAPTVLHPALPNERNAGRQRDGRGRDRRGPPARCRPRLGSRTIEKTLDGPASAAHGHLEANLPTTMIVAPPAGNRKRGRPVNCAGRPTRERPIFPANPNRGPRHPACVANRLGGCPPVVRGRPQPADFFIPTPIAPTPPSTAHDREVLRMPPAISRIVQALEPSATLAMAGKAKQLTAAGKKVFDFSVGEPDFTTPEHICRAAAEAMRAGHTHYTQASGHSRARRPRLPSSTSRHGLELSPHQVVVSNGANTLCTTFLRRYVQSRG